jgi:hypothetical protein
VKKFNGELRRFDIIFSWSYMYIPFYHFILSIFLQRGNLSHYSICLLILRLPSSFVSSDIRKRYRACLSCSLTIKYIDIKKSILRWFKQLNDLSGQT